MPSNSPPSPAIDSVRMRSTSRLSTREMAGGRQRPRTLRPVLTRHDFTYLASSCPPVNYTQAISGKLHFNQTHNKMYPNDYFFQMLYISTKLIILCTMCLWTLVGLSESEHIQFI